MAPRHMPYVAASRADASLTPETAPTTRLRETAHMRGYPSETILAVSRWMTMSSLADLPKPAPGSMQMRSRATPACTSERA